MRRLSRLRGQSTIEYAIMFTVIAGVLIIAISQILKPRMNKLYVDVGNKMDESTTGLEDKFGFGGGFSNNVISP
jgi:Flp pilus assembly pilin Flp